MTKLFETEELLTRREMIGEIVEAINEQLWSSDDKLIAEVAKLAGLDITSPRWRWTILEKKLKTHLTISR